MNIAELRVGNWVKTATPGMAVMIPELKAKVQGITIFSEVEFNHSATVQGFKMRGVHVTGIKLTEELLINSGFGTRKYEKGAYSKDGFMFVLRKDKCSNGWILRYNDEYTHGAIQFLHQLQNIYFDLENEELIFKSEIK